MCITLLPIDATKPTPINFFDSNNRIVFDVHVTVHRDNVLIINQVDALISQIYSWNENIHVSDSSSVHHQEFFTVHTAIV